MLYLLKGSRVREYHQQNVALLGAPEGEMLDISYALRWVQDGLEPASGEGCVIVLADTPWDDFVPVRFAVVRHVGMSGERLDLRVELGPRITPLGRSLLNAMWAGRSDEDRPGRVFLFTDDNPDLAVPRSLAENDEAWRASVDALAGNGFYERSTFARVVRVVDDNGDLVERERSVPVGTRLSVELELRTPHPMEGEVTVLGDADPPGAVQVERVPARPTGTVSVPMRVTADGDFKVALRILPEPLRSSRPVVRGAARIVAATAPPEGHESSGRSAPAVDVAALVVRLERDSNMDASAWVALYEDVLLRWSPADPVLLEAYARHSYDAGRFDTAIAALERIGTTRTPDGDYLLLLSSLRSGRPSQYEDLVHRIDLNVDDRFRELLDATAAASEDVWRTLMGLLPHGLLGDEKSLRFLERARAHVRTADGVLQLAELLAYSDTEAATDAILDTWPEPGSAPSKAVELLLTFDRRVNRIGPYVQTEIERLAATAQWGTLDKVVAQSQTLPERERCAALRAAATPMLRSEVIDVRQRGFALLVDTIDASLRLGDIDTAVEAAWALSEGGAGLDSEYRDLASERVAVVRAAVEQSEVFREYQRAKEHARDGRLRTRCGGWVLHVFGGKQAEWMPEIKAATGAREVRWHETEKAKSPTIEWADGLRADKDMVIVITDRIGHAASGSIKDRCAALGVIHVPSRLSRHAVLDDLDAALRSG